MLAKLFPLHKKAILMIEVIDLQVESSTMRDKVTNLSYKNLLLLDVTNYQNDPQNSYK